MTGTTRSPSRCCTRSRTTSCRCSRRGSTRSSANVRAWAMFASYMASRHRVGGSAKGIAPLPRPSRTPSALCSATTTGSSSRISARTTPAGRSTTLRAPTSSW